MSNSDDVTNYHDTLCIPLVKRAPTYSGLEALSEFLFSIFNVDISFSRIFILIESRHDLLMQIRKSCLDGSFFRMIYSSLQNSLKPLKIFHEEDVSLAFTQMLANHIDKITCQAQPH